LHKLTNARKKNIKTNTGSSGVILDFASLVFFKHYLNVYSVVMGLSLMETEITAINEKVKKESAFVNRIKDEIEKVIVDQKYMIERLDQPELDRNKLRVSGPFTVETVQPAEESLDLDSPIDGAPDDLETFAGDEPTSQADEPGVHNRVAVKVIDPRGNEVMRVHNLKGESHETTTRG